MNKSMFAGGTKSRNMLILCIIIIFSVGLLIYVGTVNKPILNGDELGSFISRIRRQAIDWNSGAGHGMTAGFLPMLIL